MTQSQQLKLAKHIMRLLKVGEVQFTFARTPKGNLAVRYTENNDQYDMMLDSVALPTVSILDDENNIELKRMFDKYLFDPENPVATMTFTPISQEKVTIGSTPEKKPIGRPKKVIEPNN